MHTVLKYLQIHGPRWLGSWEGLAVKDICSSLTAVEAHHWNGPYESVCSNLIDRKVHATFLGLIVIGSSLVIWSCFQTACNAATQYWLQRSLKQKLE